MECYNCERQFNADVADAGSVCYHCGSDNHISTDLYQNQNIPEGK
jgi:hypothetical protein